MSKGLGIQLAKARNKIKELEQRVRDWESWFQQGHDNTSDQSPHSVYEIIFHNIECPNIDADGEDCGECWLCETNRLTDNKYRR